MVWKQHHFWNIFNEIWGLYVILSSWWKSLQCLLAHLSFVFLLFIIFPQEWLTIIMSHSVCHGNLHLGGTWWYIYKVYKTFQHSLFVAIDKLTWVASQIVRLEFQLILWQKWYWTATLGFLVTNSELLWWLSVFYVKIFLCVYCACVQ